MKRTMTTTAIATLILGVAAAPALADGHSEKMTHKDMVKSKTHVSFETVDANNDMRLDFTEFSNHFEAHHGWSAADSAIQFTKIADDTGTVSKDAFMNIRMDKKSGHMDMMTETSKKMPSMETTTTTTTVETSTVMGTSEPVMRETRTTTRTTSYGSGSLIGLGSSINYGAFADYDRNSDGMVSFTEYSKLRAKSGVSATQSAQEFIRLSNGQRNFDQTRFNSAVSLNVLG